MSVSDMNRRKEQGGAIMILLLAQLGCGGQKNTHTGRWKPIGRVSCLR